VKVLSLSSSVVSFFSPLLYAVESLATCDELNKLGAELILADLEA